MFKSDEEVNDLLNHSNNGSSVVVKIIGNGQDDRVDRRNSGERKTLSLETKASIATMASILGVKTTSEMTGLTPGMTSRLKNGKNGVNIPDQDLKEAIEERKSGIQGKALEKAELFLEMLDLGSDLSDSLKRASIAEKVVNIYEKLSPKEKPGANIGTQVIFYAPRVKESSDYPVIEVEAQNG